MNKEVVLTGLRSNSEFHLGNLLGAILPMVALQKKLAGQRQFNMFIPDLHSFTTPVDHAVLYQQSLENLKVFVAAGLDINQPDTFIYRQSYIPAHSELTWILGCFTYYGELTRMVEFKEKSGLSEVQKEDVVNSIMERMEQTGMWEQVGQGASLEDQRRLLDIATGPFIDEIRGIVKQKTEHANASLLTYPVLMAADILLYDAQWVPVGEDQRQHLELTRNIALRMNSKFGPLFTLPHEWNEQLKFIGQNKGVRVRSLRNPAKKMSKSIDDPSGTIMLRDNPDEAAQKIMSATTDSENSIHFDWQNQPGVTNLLQILTLLGGQSQAEVNSAWEAKESYGELKSAVAGTVKTYLTDFQARFHQVDELTLLQKLEADEANRLKVAGAKLLKIQQAVGLRPRN